MELNLSLNCSKTSTVHQNFLSICNVRVCLFQTTVIAIVHNTCVNIGVNIDTISHCDSYQWP